MTSGAPSPLVSVVITAFNRERYIRPCIESVLGQTYPRLEIIVVDDASTDRTREVVASCGPRVRMVARDRNSGLPAVARNEGIRAATGDCVAFLDSDDLWYPEKVARQVAYLAAHPDVAAVHTRCHVVDEEGRALYVRRETDMPAGETVFHHLLRECFITLSTVMVRRPVLDALGGFNETPRLKCGEDAEFYLRLARDHRVALVPDVLAGYRKHADNISEQDALQAQAWILNTRRFVLEHDDLWRGRASRRDVTGALRDACLEFSHFWQDREHRGRAASFAARAVAAQPWHSSGYRRLAGALLGRLKAPASRGR